MDRIQASGQLRRAIAWAVVGLLCVVGIGAVALYHVLVEAQTAQLVAVGLPEGGLQRILVHGVLALMVAVSMIEVARSIARTN